MAFQFHFEWILVPRVAGPWRRRSSLSTRSTPDWKSVYKSCLSFKADFTGCQFVCSRSVSVAYRWIIQQRRFLCVMFRAGWVLPPWLSVNKKMNLMNYIFTAFSRHPKCLPLVRKCVCVCVCPLPHPNLVRFDCWLCSWYHTLSNNTGSSPALLLLRSEERRVGKECRL